MGRSPAAVKLSCGRSGPRWERPGFTACYPCLVPCFAEASSVCWRRSGDGAARGPKEVCLIVIDPLIGVIQIALQLYFWAVIISAILSWLIAFNVINTSNRFVYTVVDFLWRLTEPALRPIRQVLGRFLPNLGGIDISPVILILILYFLRDLIVSNIVP